MKTEVHYSSQIIEDVIGRLWLKWCLKHLVAESILLAVALGLWFSGIYRNLAVSTLAGLALAAILIETATYFVYRNRSLRLFEKMESPGAVWSFDEEFIGVEADTGMARYRWDIIKALYLFDRAWVLMYVNRTISVLPVEGIPAELREFIRKKASEHGAAIISS